MIETIDDLICRLEKIRRDLPPTNGQSITEYEHVGWSRRHIEELLEQCREQAESLTTRRPQLGLAPLRKCDPGKGET